MTVTRRQRDVLDYMRSYVVLHRVAPTYEEIRQALRLRSLASVHAHIHGLVERGVIRRDPRRARAIEFVDCCPTCGRTAVPQTF